MPIVDLYSSRKAKEQKTSDVWVYDQIPAPLRVQVSNVVRGALGTINEYSDHNAISIYQFIRDSVANEHGRDRLRGEDFAPSDVHMCIRSEGDTLVWLDVIELCFRSVEKIRGKLNSYGRDRAEISISGSDAIHELNERFRRSGFGYRYENGQLIRIDSEFMHQEATRPTLTLLSDPRFLGADEEFRAAHEHLKAGEYKDCTVDALNALESTIKAICDAKKWEYPQGARVSDLLKVLRRENLFPDFADQSFEQLLATLKSGLPLVRNQTGGHGQGATPVDVPAYVAVYALNLAASKIRFLVDAFKNSEE